MRMKTLDLSRAEQGIIRRRDTNPRLRSLQLLSNTILSLAILMYSVPRAIQAESVIFEQFGTLVGSTSYLHVHIPLYISKMLEQHDKYLDYVESKFSSPEKIRNWLFAGAFEAFNITSENVRKGTIT